MQKCDKRTVPLSLENRPLVTDLANDVNIYVVDLNEGTSSASNRVSVGSTGSIAATPTVKDIDVYDSSNTVTAVYSFENVDFANYAYFKVVEDEITDIVVVLPKN